MSINPVAFDAMLQARLVGAGWQREVVWETDDGPVCVWSVVRDEKKPTVYLSAGIHGDEPAGPLAVAEMLIDECNDGGNWIVFPMLHPGACAHGRRDDAMGRDLNRDYFFRESLEVRAHVNWLEKIPPPDLMLSLHEDWESRGFYFYEINLRADRPERAAAILRAVESVMPIEPMHVIDDHEVREQGWIYHEPRADFPDSWPEAIYMAERGCPLSLTFETPSRAFSLEKRIAAHRAAVRAALACCL